MIKIRKLKRILTRILRMEAEETINLGLELARTQIKIRPRLRLILAVLTILGFLHTTSFTLVSAIRPKEAQIKILGQPILVAAEGEVGETVPASEISYAVDFRRSPFEFNLPVDGYLSQGYRSYHPAHDIAAPLGSPIHPVGAGVVEFAGRVFDGKGNVVIIDHGDGLKSLYAHMGKINVGVGNLVESDTVLGTVGLTGRTTGPHVHLEIYDRGQAVNPANILP